MVRSRRQFITSLTVTGCAYSLFPFLVAKADDTAFSRKHLRREIAAYGKVIGLEQKGDCLDAKVRIQRIENLSRACDAFSRFGSVHASGNELRFSAGGRRIRIQNLI
jgi:hypothetical protein